MQNPIIRLYGLLRASLAEHGCPLEPFDPFESGWEAYALGEGSAIGFFEDQVFVAFGPEDGPGVRRQVLRMIRARQKAGIELRSAVYLLNWKSLAATRRLGGVPVGIDANGFVHYRWLPEAPRHGQEGPQDP